MFVFFTLSLYSSVCEYDLTPYFLTLASFIFSRIFSLLAGQEFPNFLILEVCIFSLISFTWKIFLTPNFLRFDSSNFLKRSLFMQSFEHVLFKYPFLILSTLTLIRAFPQIGHFGKSLISFKTQYIFV